MHSSCGCIWKKCQPALLRHKSHHSRFYGRRCLQAMQAYIAPACLSVGTWHHCDVPRLRASLEPLDGSASVVRVYGIQHTVCSIRYTAYSIRYIYMHLPFNSYLPWHRWLWRARVGEPGPSNEGMRCSRSITDIIIIIIMISVLSVIIIINIIIVIIIIVLSLSLILLLSLLLSLLVLLLWCTPLLAIRVHPMRFNLTFVNPPRCNQFTKSDGNKTHAVADDKANRTPPESRLNRVDGQPAKGSTQTCLRHFGPDLIYNMH